MKTYSDDIPTSTDINHVKMELMKIKFLTKLVMWGTMISLIALLYLVCKLNNLI